MKINDDHRLYHDDDTPYSFVESPNFYKEVDFDYLVWHYTANNKAESAITKLSEKNGTAGVSAHLVIDLDGTITQLVPFNKGAWHAGESHWEGKRYLNHNSIGIEIVNDGKLKRVNKTTQWVASSLKTYEEGNILVAKHPHEFFEAGWPLYPQVQLDAILEVSRLLVNHYELKDALGHEDIADARIGKIDPGPAFPKDDFREKLFNRRQPVYVTYELTEDVQVIEDLGKLPSELKKSPALHPSSPLPPNTDVNIGQPDVNGWVSAKINGTKGWMDAVNLKQNKQKFVTVASTVVYASAPAVSKENLQRLVTLTLGFQVRILRKESNYVLVKSLQGASGRKVVQGWIPYGTFNRRVETAV